MKCDPLRIQHSSVFNGLQAEKIDTALTEYFGQGQSVSAEGKCSIPAFIVNTQSSEWAVVYQNLLQALLIYQWPPSSDVILLYQDPDILHLRNQ